MQTVLVVVLEVAICKGVMLGFLTAALRFLMTHLHELIKHCCEALSRMVG